MYSRPFTGSGPFGHLFALVFGRGGFEAFLGVGPRGVTSRRPHLATWSLL